jgi:NADH dehydrogenase (ubiquinone) Fe-S protein 3
MNLNDTQLEKFGKSLMKMIPNKIEKIIYRNDELILHVSTMNLLKIMKFLKNHTNCQFKQLSDISGTDYPERKNRFEVAYQLLSIQYNTRIRIKTFVDEITDVPSVTNIFSSADWMEREVWDMFGVFFSGHPDLRRILTDYGFEGHPLRKDFPLSGYVEIRYDDELKRVVSEPLELTQEFRNFNYRSPWEQVK